MFTMLGMKILALELEMVALETRLHFFAGFGFLGTIQLMNFHEMGSSRWNHSGQVSVFGYEYESKVPLSA